MNNPESDNHSLTPDDLRRYRSGQLSAAEQHRIERLLLERPFYADALEGLEAMDQQGVSAGNVSKELRGRLQQRVQPSTIRRLPVWVPAAAASVLVVLGIVAYFLLPEAPPDRAQVAVRPAPTAPQPAFRSDSNKEVAAAPADQTALNSPALARKKTELKRPELARQPVQPDSTSIGLADEALALSPPPAAAYEAPVVPVQAERRLLAAPGSANSLITGRVVDEQNRPLPGAIVVLKSTRQGVSTDTTGQFQLDKAPGNDSLLIQSIGYQSKAIRVADAGQRAIQLKPDTIALSEVVVVGYGKQQRKEISGAVAPIRNASLPKAPNGYQDYLRKNRRIPSEAATKPLAGVVRVRFRVNVNGSLDHFSVTQSLGTGYDEEAIRLLREGPRWQPARRNGQPDVQFTEQTIEF